MARCLPVHHLIRWPKTQPLTEAVKQGDEEKVAYLLNQDSKDCEISGIDGANALGLACMFCTPRKLGIVRLLVANKRFPVNPNQQGIQGTQHPVYQAIESGNTELLKLLLNESVIPVDLNFLIYRYGTALRLAIEKNNLTIINILLETGADPTFLPPSYGKSALFTAVELKKQQVVQLFMEHTRDINTMLHQPMSRSYWWPKDSVFTFVAEQGMYDFAKLFLDHGADIFLNNHSVVKTALDYDQYEIIHLFLEHTYKQAGEQMHELWRVEPIYWAIERQAMHCLGLLLYWGIYSFSKYSSSLLTVFHRAANRGDIQILKMIFQFDPLCMQENWLVEGRIPRILLQTDHGREFMAEIAEVRRQPSRLDVLCRTKIIDHLACIPFLKVETLPLPTALRHFMCSPCVKLSAYYR